MSLRDMANKTLNSFDASKDKVNTFEGLPTGEYHILLEDFTHRTTDSGWDGLSIVTSVIEGDLAGRKDYNSFNFDTVSANGKPIPDSVIDARIKLVAQLAWAIGVTLQDEDWESIDTLVSAFMEAKGRDLMMNLTVKENKRNPQYPYKTYEFKKSEETGFNNPVDIDDSQLPF